VSIARVLCMCLLVEFGVYCLLLEFLVVCLEFCVSIVYSIVLPDRAGVLGHRGAGHRAVLLDAVQHVEDAEPLAGEAGVRQEVLHHAEPRLATSQEERMLGQNAGFYLAVPTGPC
jgi:hypothetical protein